MLLIEIIPAKRERGREGEKTNQIDLKISLTCNFRKAVKVAGLTIKIAHTYKKKYYKKGTIKK